MYAYCAHANPRVDLLGAIPRRPGAPNRAPVHSKLVSKNVPCLPAILQLQRRMIALRLLELTHDPG